MRHKVDPFPVWLVIDSFTMSPDSILMYRPPGHTWNLFLLEKDGFSGAYIHIIFGFFHVRYSTDKRFSKKTEYDIKLESSLFLCLMLRVVPVNDFTPYADFVSTHVNCIVKVKLFNICCLYVLRNQMVAFLFIWS